jgi:hypothetical protein
MSILKKPTGQPEGVAKSIAPETAPTLSPAELRFVMTLRSMEADAAQCVMGIAARMAKKMPRHTRPKLWLITGGTS